MHNHFGEALTGAASIYFYLAKGRKRRRIVCLDQITEAHPGDPLFFKGKLMGKAALMKIPDDLRSI